MFLDSINHLFYQSSPQEDLKKFHSQMTEIFSPLRVGTLSDNLTEVAERVAKVVFSPFVYLILGVLTCIEWTFQWVAYLYQTQSEESIDSSLDVESTEEKESPITEQLNEEDALTVHSPKQSGLEEKNDLNRIPQLEMMRSIKQSRLDNIEEELVRLRKQKTLTPDLEKEIDNALAKVKTYYRVGFPSYEPQVKMLLGRALEIKNLYQNTHYIFSHAQATKYFVPVCLIKELVKVFFPERNVQFSQFLRVPQLRTTEVKDFKSILVDASINSVINDHQTEVREKLLSVDAHLFNTEECESALNFLCRNYSVLDNYATGFKDLFSFIFSHFFTKRIPKTEFHELCNRAVNIAYRVRGVCGNLFMICIPKKLVEDPDKTIVYRAHPFGRPCDCHPENEDIEIIKQLQQGNLNLNYLCRGSVVPQFRLLAAALTPENEVYSFGLTPFTKAEKKMLKADITKLAADAYKAQQSAV